MRDDELTGMWHQVNGYDAMVLLVRDCVYGMMN